ncbi:MAG: hypothetical protein OXJ52_03655, partial [Oligoflexia bacterium]|nr:hypothetical protein [Oligoflexia bacterium]
PSHSKNTSSFYKTQLKLPTLNSPLFLAPLIKLLSFELLAFSKIKAKPHCPLSFHPFKLFFYFTLFNQQNKGGLS